MLESGLSGSVRGVPSNGHPYRDPISFESPSISCGITNRRPGHVASLTTGKHNCAGSASSRTKHSPK